MDLTDKQVLLIMPGFYGYEKLVSEALEKLGAKVTYLENKAFRNDPITRDTRWYLTFLCKKDSYIRKNLIPKTRNKFDVCLFINLFSFHPELIENLKKQNPNILTVLYLWDNIKNYCWQPFFKFFDRIYSFDPLDSRNLEVNYLPNFYPSILSSEGTEANKFDVSFVGSLQMHRLKILDDLAAKLRYQNKAFFFHLYLHPNYNKLKFNKYIHAILKILPGQFDGYKVLYKLITQKSVHDLVHHTPLTLSESIQSLANSRCVLDLPFPSQSGSTQRLIHALALQKKVITTNSTVTEESFYNPDYIQVVSSEDVVIDWDWVTRKSEVALNVDHLRLDNWLTQLFKTKT